MKRYILSLGLILAVSNVFSQAKQEIGVFLGGGVSTFNYTNAEKRVEDKLGFTTGFSYQYFLNEKLSLKSGVEFSRYNAKTFVNSTMGSVGSVDNEGDAFDYKYSIGGYKESQHTYLLNIPVMLGYDLAKLTESTGLYGAIGFKLGLPVSSRYSGDMSSVSTSGYYPHTNVTYDDLAFRGFGQYTGKNSSGKFDTKIQVLGSAEFGLRSRIGERMLCYTSLYFDYGLTSLTSQNKTFINYNVENPQQITNESILNSKFTGSNGQDKFVNKVHIMAIGLKVNLAYEF